MPSGESGMPLGHADAQPAAHAYPPADRPGFHESDVTWLDQALALRTFLDEHGRPPGTGAGSTEHERRLARWLKSQREAEHDGRLLGRRSAWLDQWVPGWRRPRAQSWRTTAVAVGLHVARSGEYPSASSPDPETRRLGTWLRTQRRAKRDGRLDEARERWLDLNLPYWASPVAETWYGTAALVAEFVTEHQRMPRAEADPDESRLARWLRTQRSAARAGKLDREQLGWLDASIPGWRNARAIEWQHRVDEVTAFVERHGTLPAPGGIRRHEQRLAAWLTAQRTALATDMLSAERRDRLDTLVPGWSDSPTDRWPARLATAAEFLAEHGRLPARSADADDAERRIAAWLSAQRRAERSGRLTRARREQLDARIPGWQHAGEAAWRARAEQLVAFAAANSRLPAVREHDPEARALAVWLGRQRTLATEGRLADGRERWLRLHVPGWRDHNLGAWIGTAERVIAFRAEHGRLPTRSAGAAPLERELGVWLNNQRTAERDGRLGAERRRWLTEQLPDWDDSRLAAWLARAIEVEEYVDERGRLPHARSTNPRSKRLGGWLETQRAAARSGRLKTNRHEWLDAHVPGWDEVAAHGTQPRQAADTHPAAAHPAAADERAARVLGEWTERLRTRDLPITDEQRRWLDRRLPGWDQQTA